MTDQRETPPAELPALPWPPLLLFGAVVGAWALGRVFPLGWPGVDDEAAHSVGLGIGIAGVALLVWSAMTLRRHGTTFLPSRASATQLVTDGPYAIRRNPIYIADVLMLFGVAELTKNVWFAIFAVAFVPSRDVARHSARGAASRRSLRRRLPRLQGVHPALV